MNKNRGFLLFLVVGMVLVGFIFGNLLVKRNVKSTGNFILFDKKGFIQKKPVNDEIVEIKKPRQLTAEHLKVIDCVYESLETKDVLKSELVKGGDEGYLNAMNLLNSEFDVILSNKRAKESFEMRLKSCLSSAGVNYQSVEKSPDCILYMSSPGKKELIPFFVIFSRIQEIVR